MIQIISTKASLKTTVKEIIDVVIENKKGAFKKPDFLKKQSTLETCRTLWYFVKNNINYTPDDFLTEQIRTPQRTWNDREKGVDCEDYSIYIASCLMSLGIEPTLRIVGNEQGFQHIYIVVKDTHHVLNDTQTIILDCCMDDFNKEAAYSKVMDISIKKGGESQVPEVGGYMLQRLSGVADLQKSTAEILAYEGKGGQGKTVGVDAGILTQFFTPDWVVDLMWKLCIHYGFKGGNVLEPSCGTGRFIYQAPKEVSTYSNFIGFEREEMLANMAQQLKPEAKIYNNYFETAFLKKVGAFYQPMGDSKSSDTTWLPPMDLVIGNPPYGIWKNLYSSLFKINGMNQIEQFFMLQGLKTLKKGGLMCYITASSFASTYEKYMKTKMDMDSLCTLVDAYRLPNVFKYTNVPTDILIFRKK